MDSTAFNQHGSPTNRMFGSGVSSAFKKVERTPKLNYLSPFFKLEDLITRRNSLTSNKDSEIIRTPPIGTEELMEEDKTPQTEK